MIPDTARADYEARLGALIEERIGLIALEALDDAGLEELAEHMQQEESTGDTMVGFLRSKIADFDQRMQDAIVGFAREFISAARLTA